MKSKSDSGVDLANFDFDKELSKLGVESPGASLPVDKPVKKSQAKGSAVAPRPTAGAGAGKLSSTNPFWVLLAATLLSIALSFIPYAQYVVYPFKLFVTFIHEMSHAFVALVTGGDIAKEGLLVHWNTAGETYTVGGWNLFIASAGYLGSMICGCGLLLVARSARLAKPALFAVGFLIAIFTLKYGLNWPTALIGFTLSGGLITAAALTGKKIAHYIVSFLSIQCVLNAIYDLKVLIGLPSNTPSDAFNMSQAVYGWAPPIVFAGAWFVLALGMLFFVMRSYYKLYRA